MLLYSDYTYAINGAVFNVYNYTTSEILMNWKRSALFYKPSVYIRVISGKKCIET